MVGRFASRTRRSSRVLLAAFVACSSAVVVTHTAASAATTPAASVGDVSVGEGQSANRKLLVAVTLSSPAPAGGSIVYLTAHTFAGNTATAGSDYTPITKPKKVKFAAGATAKVVKIAVAGDSAVEGNETFTLSITAGTNATIARATGTVTILNDDPVTTPPALRIGDVTIVEGNSGDRQISLPITIDHPTSKVTARATTTDVSASHTSDYVAVTNQLVSVKAGKGALNLTVHSDTAQEGNETFSVNLTGVTGATAARVLGTVTILDDDGVPKPTVSAPASPSSNATPTITVHALPETTASLYKSATCTGSPVYSSIVPLTGVLNPAVPVTPNTTTAFTVKAVNSLGQVSACSTSASYTHDSIAPAQPGAFTITPNAQFNNNNDPVVKGSADADSTVQVFRDGSCAGVPVTGPGSTFSTTGIAVHVTDDTITSLSARAVDAAGNASPCVAVGTYIEDSSNPAAPTNIHTTPDSPGHVNPIVVSGLAESGSTVAVYTNSSCAGPAAATGTATEFASGLSVTVNPNTTTNLSARATDIAGNVGDCAVPQPFVHDSIPPDPPSNVTITPLSPANNNSPTVSGVAETASAVTLFQSHDCSGGVLGTGTAAGFLSPGITIGVPNNSSTPISEHVTDAAGNVSSCADAGTFVEDSGAPDAPTGLGINPAGPANNNLPVLHGSSEAGSTVTAFKSADCSGGVAATTDAGTFSAPGVTVPVGDDTTTQFSVRATDAAGNASSCATGPTYVEDSTAPSTPAITGASPGSNTTSTASVVLTGTADADSTVLLYLTSDCSGNDIAYAVPGQFPSGGISTGVSPGTTVEFHVRAIDAAGNLSQCSAGFAYVDPPAQTGFTLTITEFLNFGDPSSPIVRGTISPAAGDTHMRISVFVDSPCAGGFVGSGESNGPDGSTFNGFARMLSPGTHTIYVNGYDSLSNTTSACSAGASYTV